MSETWPPVGGVPALEGVDPAAQRRWRLILGADADEALTRAGELSPVDRRRDAALDYLYQREYLARQVAAERGIGQEASEHEARRRGGIGTPAPEAVRWLGEVRELFPRSAAETLQRDALSRYGIDSLLSDPRVLAEATPSIELVATLMAIRASLPAPVLAEAQRLVARVVAQLEARLAPRVHAAFAPKRRRHGGRGRPRLADLDWPRTLRHNLRHYQPTEQLLVLERLFFRAREAQRLPWELWLVVDQSGSMCESVIHSAVMGSIFARVRALNTRLLLFSDQVVDATAQLQAPESLLMGAQLGGGTDIGAALGHVADHLASPRRCVVVLISDLYEGYDEGRVLHETARLVGSGARVLALAALDRRAQPDYDRDLAAQLAALGADVAAMTPDHLVDWLAGCLWGHGA